MTDDTTPPPSRFVRGNDHLDRLLSDPQLAATSPRPGRGRRHGPGLRHEPGHDP